MAADALGSVARHHADDERAGDGDEDDEHAEMMSGGRDEGGVDALEKEKIRKETDQLEERRGDQGGKDTDGRGQSRDWQHAARRREIAEVIERRVASTACMASHIFECNIRRGAADRARAAPYTGAR